jgi:6-phosphogluconolactonase
VVRDRGIFIFPDNEVAAHFAVKKWVEISSKSITDRGYFSVALSGGRTPVDFYKTLSTSKHMPWDKTHIFLADERFVSQYDKESNYRLIRETLLKNILIPEENVHPIQTDEDTSDKAARKYEEVIRGFFHILNDKIPRFDLIMLGMGEDGHTASLFPGTSSIKEKKRLVIPVIADKSPSERISLTLPVLNSAKHIIFLISGEKKARAVKDMLENEASNSPAALVKPEDLSLMVLLDKGAASLLSDYDRSRYLFRFQS